MFNFSSSYDYIKPKVDAGKALKTGCKFSMGKGRQPPLYGTWPKFPEPCNTRQRRHYIVKSTPKVVDTEPKRPPLVHLDHLKHRREFPKLRNASQLANLY